MGKVISMELRKRARKQNSPAPSEADIVRARETEERMNLLHSIYDKHVELLKKRGD